MIDILSARLVAPFVLALAFSDGSGGVWDARPLLTGSGSLLVPLRDPVYFARCFVEAGALCWPNGLELDPAVLREQVVVTRQELTV